MDDKLRQLLYQLPEVIYRSVSKIEYLEEIRLRCEKRICAFDGIKNIVCETILDRENFHKTLSVLCSGALYTHMNTINDGYISRKGGIRIGVAGRATLKGGKIDNISEISSICIRIPHEYNGISSEVIEKITENLYTDSILLFSPPGIGKTTVIRDIISSLASYPHSKRLCVVDSRREIETERFMAIDNLDILSGYPKAHGISIATRSMNPQYLVCDEIGELEEAKMLLSASNVGVPLIASAHAKNINELLSRSNIKLLHKQGVFDMYVKIERENERRGINKYTFYRRAEIT